MIYEINYQFDNSASIVQNDFSTKATKMWTQEGSWK